MRKALDLLYGAALVGACLAMIAIVTLVFAEVLGRVVDRLAVLVGIGRFGFTVPSLAEIGGFLFVAASFLALPATLRAGAHVRVTLALRAFGIRGEKVMNVLVLLVAIGLALFAFWSVWTMTYASYLRGSVSVGIIPIPLWIPQAVMTTGLAVFAIALIDELVAILRGGEAAFRHSESQREASEGGH